MILDNWIGWLQVRIPSLKNGTNVFWLKQAISGHAEYWRHRCLLAENVIKNSKVNVTSEMLDAIEMLDYFIDNQGLNCTPRIEAFLKQNAVNKNDFKSSVVESYSFDAIRIMVDSISETHITDEKIRELLE